MNKEAQSIVVVLLGGLILAITVSGRFTAYVNPGFAPLLWIGGSILVLVGVWSLVETALTRTGSVAGDPSDDHDHDPDEADHDHDHDRSRAPWLILAPVLVLLVMAPPALGAESLARHAGSQALAGLRPLGVEAGSEASDGSGALPVTGADRVVRDGSGRATLEFGRLTTGTDQPIPLREFILRALYDEEGSVVDTSVTVVGFIGPADAGRLGGWSLARVSIACCAADATALRVHVDAEPEYPLNTWVRAVVRAVPGTATPQNKYVPTVEIVALTAIEQPTVPYE